MIPNNFYFTILYLPGKCNPNYDDGLCVVKIGRTQRPIGRNTFLGSIFEVLKVP